jgi:hypothetical protein
VEVWNVIETMNDKKSSIEQQCRAAIDRVDLAMLNHEKNKPEDLSLPLLGKVKEELIQMKTALSPAVFRPSYGRFVLDWPDEHGLVRLLSDVGYQYERLK